MGCSASKNVVVPAASNNNIPKDDGKMNGQIKDHEVNSYNEYNKPVLKAADRNERRNTQNKIEAPKASLAFDVSLDGQKVESLILKHPPKKLQRLEFSTDHPKLTAEMLLVKQRQAEEKRKEALAKKRETSQKTSKRRRDLFQAREFEKEQTSQQIEDQLKSAEKMREVKQKAIIEKQRIREERAKRVRKKAQKLNDPDELDIPEIEGGESFDDDNDENYWDDDVNTYNQYEPQKKVTVRSSHRQPSASTVDSVDNAFMNRGKLPNDVYSTTPVKDDFFDT